MTEKGQRAAVVAEARTWAGTPYHHRGKIKGVGTDCAQLPLCVYSAVGLFEDFDTGHYPPDWHNHREEERYLGFVQRFAHEIPREAVGPGDLILWKFGRAHAHGTIVLELPMIIHASQHDRAVMLGNIEQESQFIGRAHRCFSFWGKPDVG